MKLDAFLKQGDIGREAFAARIGSTAVAVGRYINGDRIPDRRLMAAIARETQGLVQPNDFYDLPAAQAAFAPGGDAGHPPNSIGVSSDDCLGAGVGVQNLSVGGK